MIIIRHPKFPSPKPMINIYDFSHANFNVGSNIIQSSERLELKKPNSTCTDVGKVQSIDWNKVIEAIGALLMALPTLYSILQYLIPLLC